MYNLEHLKWEYMITEFAFPPDHFLQCVHVTTSCTLEDWFVHAGHTRAIMLPRKALDVNLQRHWANRGPEIKQSHLKETRTDMNKDGSTKQSKKNRPRKCERKTVIKREMECPAGCVPDRVAHLGVITACHCPLSHNCALTQVARAWVRVCTYLKVWIMDWAARDAPQSKQHTSDLWRPPALPSPSV